MFNPKSMSDLELLSIVYGRNDAELLLDSCNGQIGNVIREAEAAYTVPHRLLCATIELMQRALVEELRFRDTLGSPGRVREMLQLHFMGREYESFVMLSLDAQNRLIQFDEMFRGTLTQTSVYPREVVKLALKNNSAGVVFSHNHPSGICEPSSADRLLTSTLKNALALVDVKVHDHFLVGSNQVLSFAEQGLL